MENTTGLGERVAASHLSIPEYREVVLHLKELVEDDANGLRWGFRSSVWDEGRMTSVAVLNREGAIHHLVIFTAFSFPFSRYISLRVRFPSLFADAEN